MAELDEEQGWIRKSREGDHDAFATLVRRHQRMIHALTYRMTGSLADAEDVAQETFICAFQQIASFRGDARFSTWLYQIAVRLCLNWIDRRNRRETIHSTWGEHHESESAPDHGRVRLVQDALMKLKPKHRAALILTVYDGLNHAEAARVLGCAETTVSWRVFAARNQLKKILKVFPTGAAADE